MKRLILDGAPFKGTEEEFISIEDFDWKEWVLNDRFHRIDGPAIIYPNGTEFWYQNGNKHRDNGPALIYSDEYQEYWPCGDRHWYWYVNDIDLSWMNDWLPLNHWICGE